MPEKVCGKCGLAKSLASFYKDKKTKDGLQNRCIPCAREHSRLYSRTIEIGKRREGSRRTLLKTKYGLTLERYNEMLKSQNGVCAICQKPETSRSNHKGPVDSLRVDHCHRTGQIRGLLCSECNFGISKFKDNLGLILSAMNYLLGSKQNEIKDKKQQ